MQTMGKNRRILPQQNVAVWVQANRFTDDVDSAWLLTD